MAPGPQPEGPLVEIRDPFCFPALRKIYRKELFSAVENGPWAPIERGPRGLIRVIFTYNYWAVRPCVTLILRACRPYYLALSLRKWGPQAPFPLLKTKGP